MNPVGAVVKFMSASFFEYTCITEKEIRRIIRNEFLELINIDVD
jgi:hypothetical protein